MWRCAFSKSCDWTGSTDGGASCVRRHVGRSSGNPRAWSSEEIETKLVQAGLIITSRLAAVEAARAFFRLRQSGEVAETLLGELERSLAEFWARTELWELTPAVCDLAAIIAPSKRVRTLDALHLATFVLARKWFEGIELLTADARLGAAVGG